MEFRRSNVLLLAAAVSMPLFGAGMQGCASTSIAAKEMFGYAKREQLVDEVQEARDSQAKAKAQFADALEEFLAVTKVDTKGLEAQYKKLKSELDACKSRASNVRSQIKDVENVAERLFKEWRAELAQYSSPDLRRSSERQLEDTQRQYQQLIGVMKSAADKMDPVLARFNDQVLFLKHNLNAAAIAGLEGTSAALQSEINSLIADMERSINEANAFIDQMGKK